MASRYAIWKRKPGYGPGWPELWVLCDEQGRPVYADSAGSGVQVATVELTPFVMKQKDLMQRYGPERVAAPQSRGLGDDPSVPPPNPYRAALSDEVGDEVLREMRKIIAPGGKP